MYDEVKTMEQYLCCLSENLSVYWKMVLELENEGFKDSPDYHRAVAAWAAYDTAICLFKELMENTQKERSS